MLDLDTLKAFNVLEASQEGVLLPPKKSVAKSMASCLRRTSDLIAPLGGEDFAVVLLETPYEGTLE